MYKKITLAFFVATLLSLYVSAQDKMQVTADKAANLHVLSEFGPYKTIQDAEASLQKAFRKLSSQGGGILIIPNDAPEDLNIDNNSQVKFNAPAVTIYDYRKGIERIYLPPAGIKFMGLNGNASSIVERTLTQDLPPYGTFPSRRFTSFYKGGTASYSQRLLKAVKKGKDVRCYVPTMRGLFEGIYLNISGKQNHYGGKANEAVRVKSLGIDSGIPYFTADLKNDHPAKALANNKNNVNGMVIDDYNFSDNQSASLMVNRYNYSQGDSFNIMPHLFYQGNVMSANGDEGAGLMDGRIWQDMKSFRGKVESWNPKTRELKYQPGAHYPNTLGTSRPILNMNEKKWLTKGKVIVIKPGMGKKFGVPEARYSLIVGNKDVDWDESVAGRWIAISDPSECYPGGKGIKHGTRGHSVYRWWHITKVKKREDGMWNLFVETVKWNANRNSGPNLFDSENYSDPRQKKFKELSYIIAPGAWTADVRNGIGGFKNGSGRISSKTDDRVIKVAPSTLAGTIFDFEKNDPIHQPVGPNPYKPIGFRVRHMNYFPGMAGTADVTLMSHNTGSVQVGAVLYVRGSGRKKSLKELLEKRKDHRPEYGSAVFIGASTEDGIVFDGLVSDSAILFNQRDKNIKPLKWNLLKGKASFYCDPENADFVFNGGNISISGKSTVNTAGISATAKASRNLRGINVKVIAGSQKVEVKFKNSEPDADYLITVQPNWMTMDRTVRKTKSGFIVEFSASAPKAAAFDWLLIR